MASGGMAAAGSLCIVYPLDYARTRLASDVGAGKSAIIAGAGISYPFDTVRRRLQMQAEKPKEEHLYQGTVDCLKKIAAEEGVAAGLYKGFIANALRSVGGALVP